MHSKNINYEIVSYILIFLIKGMYKHPELSRYHHIIREIKKNHIDEKKGVPFSGNVRAKQMMIVVKHHFPR